MPVDPQTTVTACPRSASGEWCSIAAGHPGKHSYSSMQPDTDLTPESRELLAYARAHFTAASSERFEKAIPAIERAARAPLEAQNAQLREALANARAVIRGEWDDDGTNDWNVSVLERIDDLLALSPSSTDARPPEPDAIGALEDAMSRNYATGKFDDPTDVEAERVAAYLLDLGWRLTNAAHDAEIARAAVEPWRKVVKGVLHLLDTYGGGPSGYDKVLREVRALLAHSEEGEPSKPFGDGTTPNRGGSSEFGR